MSSSSKYFRGRRPEMHAFLPDQFFRVLEIGCGEGEFLADRAHEIEYWGVELNVLAAEKAGKHLHRVYSGAYDQVVEQLPVGYFDVVICNDVIEHMVDHDGFLRAIRRQLKPGGWLVGSIPNVRHYSLLLELLFERDWQYRDSGLLDRTHLRFFTEKSLRRSLTESGLVIESLHGINRTRRRLFPINIGLRTAALFLLSALSFGAYRDIWYLQFGFRARSD